MAAAAGIDFFKARSIVQQNIQMRLGYKPPIVTGLNAEATVDKNIHKGVNAFFDIFRGETFSDFVMCLRMMLGISENTPIKSIRVSFKPGAEITQADAERDFPWSQTPQGYTILLSSVITIKICFQAVVVKEPTSPQDLNAAW